MHWLRRRQREKDLERELRSDLELEEEEQREHGLSAGEARYAARRGLGNVAIIAEDMRATWASKSIEGTILDLRYALRFLRRSPVFTATAILSLALGIGMNTAMFTLLDAVLLRSLPVRSPQDLVLIAERSGSRDSFSLSWPEFQALKDSDALTGMSAFRPWRFHTTVHGEPALVDGQLVSGNYFSLLGVPAVLGRTLVEQDDQTPGANPVAVLSYEYWRSKLASDPSVIGQNIDIQGYPFTVIGVAAPEFFGLEPGKEIDITVPLSMQAIAMPGTPLLQHPDARWLRLVGRRQPGVSLEQAQANLAVRWARLMATVEHSRVRDDHVEVLPGAQGLYDLRRRFSLPLRALMGAVALFLLIACANLASLLLARGTARQQEIDLRLSLGASGGRLLRQLLTESTLLSIVGGICGIALACLATPLLAAIMSRGRAPLFLDFAIHTRTLLFTGAVSLLAGLLFGLIPALRATATGTLHGFRLARRNRRTWTRALISSQIALCLAILVCAGLLLGSVHKLRQVDTGFRKDHVLLMSIRPELSNYKGPRAGRLYQELWRRFSALPGVTSAILSMDTPLGGVSYTSMASVPGWAGASLEGMEASVNAVGPRFFETMGIPVLAGRDFTSRDREPGPLIAVISESIASKLFSGRSPLGQHIEIGGSLEIVGVVKETRYNGLRQRPTPMVYRPYLQMADTWGELFFGIRTVGNPEAMAAVVRRELNEAAPDVPVFSLTTLDAQVDADLVRERMVSTLSAWFGAFALFLASIGLYGSLSYAVAERTRETGIRLALGAGRAVVMWTILREVLEVVVCGVLAGLPVALVSSRAIGSLLYGLQPFDPSIVMAVMITIAGAAVLAGYLPARRASRIDPMAALRYE
jgi:predicted permease